MIRLILRRCLNWSPIFGEEPLRSTRIVERELVPGVEGFEICSCVALAHQCWGRNVDVVAENEALSRLFVRERIKLATFADNIAFGPTLLVVRSESLAIGTDMREAHDINLQRRGKIEKFLEGGRWSMLWRLRSVRSPHLP